MKDFKPEEFEFKPFDFRMAIYSIVNPYKAGKFIGQYNPRQPKPFTWGEFLWLAKWGFRGGFIFIAISLYNIYYLLQETNIEESITSGIIPILLILLAMWFLYNVRRGFMDGQTIRAAEEEKKD